MYEITLADGRKIENLKLNGNNYVSKEKVDESLLKNNLSTISISDGKTTTTMNNVELVQQVEYEDGWYLVFAEMPPLEALKAQMAYTALMTDTMI